MLRKISYSFLITIIIISPVFAQQEFYPYVAEITSEKVNVRAGGNRNYEKLLQLNKGEEIVVLDSQYGWSKIVLPANGKAYIIDKFVELLDVDEGIVTGSRVNVRGRAGTNSTVLGQLKKGDIVHIVDKMGEWYQIVPIKDSSGWVLDEFIAFMHKDVESVLEKMKTAQGESLGLLKELAELKEETLPPPEPKSIVTSGILKSQAPTSGISDIRYKLVKDGQPNYYIQGLTRLLDEFLEYTVEVEGIASSRGIGKDAYPVLKISKIQLVL